jgi:peptidoglycan/xylan/chitin deacetylase (PgdA/CDA1 family)
MFARLKNSVRNLLQRKAVILMYHQVCERQSDPWDLAVSPANFYAQLGFVSQHFDVVPLDELAASIRKKNLGSRKMAITFDDGFIDNYTIARPILESHKLPATFYLATGSLGNKNLYWWDELEMIILHTPELPAKFGVDIAGKAIPFEFRSDRVLTKELTEEIRQWKAVLPSGNERVSLFLTLWMNIQPLPFSEQRKALAAIREWAQVEAVDYPQGAVMSASEVNSLIANPLFGIGAHTVHHAMLGRQNAEVQAYEVQESKKTIEDLSRRKITGFAYPYGNYNSITKVLLRDEGFRYAVSTEQRFASEKDDIYELPRIQVKNWNQKEFAENLSKLFSHETR